MLGGGSRAHSAGLSPSRCNLKQSEAIRSNPKQPEATRSNPKQSEAIRSNPKQSEATQSNQKQSEAIGAVTVEMALPRSSPARPSE